MELLEPLRMGSNKKDYENLNECWQEGDSKCTSETCVMAFCRSVSCPEAAMHVFRALRPYGNLFVCDNTENLIGDEKKTDFQIQGDDGLLDMFLYTTSLIYGPANKKFTPGAFAMKKHKALKTINLNSKRTQRRNSIGVPSGELEHAYCRSLYGPLVDAETYILVGILHLMLHKFHRSPNFLFGLVIIRVFVVAAQKEQICKSYYSIIYNVYNFIYHKISQSMIPTQITEAADCGCGMCLFHMNLTKNDIRDSVAVLTTMLNKMSPQDIRMEKKNAFPFEILRLIYRLNQITNTIDYESFYLNELYSRIDIKEEYKNYKCKKETVILYKFTIPVVKKAELLKLENNDMQRTSLQDSFFRALFEGMTEPYLKVTINRKNLYKDTLRILKTTPNWDLKKQLKINFKDEEGVDSGGIIKEFFQLLSEELAADDSLFVEKNSTLWLKPGADLTKMKLLGKIIGIALYNNVILNLPLTPLIFKKFFSTPIGFDDLSLIEPEIHNTLCNMEKMTSEEFESLGMNFVVDCEMEGETVRKHLVKNAENTRLSKTNFLLFRDLYSKYYIDEMVSNEFTEVLDGFYSVIIGHSIDGFNYVELEKIVVGCGRIDYDQIKKHCIYQGYTEDALVVRHFWTIIGSFSKEMKRKLLKFITGNDRLPIGRAEALKFTIMKNGCDTDRLPSAQTCFNTILLPEYATYDKLHDKLVRAVEMTAGFYLM
ncbi:hypothetical protein ECANGB1_2767 [Enterospora canceri]|uniref:HECT-type E3 ubiquitin transferase n=1 Tax=Enterospora canceri TaxID=1081671 RepID=A0A1Y1SAH2_9MICR|nr:hypothetical protein ECANGB1_2767 [Enterospora canceri]